MIRSLKFDGTAQIGTFGTLLYCYEEVCKSVEESMRKTLLWKSAKPSLPGPPCHCRCYGVAPRVAAVAVAMALLLSALLLSALLRCRFRRRATPERQEAIPTQSGISTSGGSSRPQGRVPVRIMGIR